MSRREGLENEEQFWAAEMRRPLDCKENVLGLLDPVWRRGGYPGWIDPFLDSLKPTWGVERPRVVDLGCGPLSSLAWGHERGSIDLVPIDPLADEYLRMIEERSIEYPVRPLKGTGEHLASIVGNRSCHAVIALNSIDHVEDAQRCFEQVERALAPGGFFFVLSRAFEGMNEHYSGLHAWDFHPRNGRLECTDRSGRRRLDLSRSSLRLLTIWPRDVSRPPGLGVACPWFRAVFVKDGTGPDDPHFDARVLEELDVAAWRSALTPSGWIGLGLRVGPLDADTLRKHMPGWVEAPFAARFGQQPRALAALEVESGPVPALTWAHDNGFVHLRASDRRAAHFERDLRAYGSARPSIAPEAIAPEALDRHFPRASFDLAFSRHALHAVEDVQRSFEAIANCLRPGGVLFVEGSAAACAEARWRHPSRFELATREGRLEAFDRDGRARLDLARAGLRPLSVEPRDARAEGARDVPFQACLERV